MKKVKMILPALAFLFAIVGALAAQSNKDFTIVRGYLPGSQSSCTDTEDCTDVVGAVCRVGITGTGAQLFKLNGSTCNTTIYEP